MFAWAHIGGRGGSSDLLAMIDMKDMLPAVSAMRVEHQAWTAAAEQPAVRSRAWLLPAQASHLITPADVRTLPGHAAANARVQGVLLASLAAPPC